MAARIMFRNARLWIAFFGSISFLPVAVVSAFSTTQIQHQRTVRFLSPPRQLWGRSGKEKISDEGAATSLLPTLMSEATNGLNDSRNNDWTQQLIQVTLPIQEVLDTASDGWVLSYANLEPDTPQTPAGQLFLLTNVAYLVVGILLMQNCQDYWLGPLTDLVSLLSFNYHYQQLQNTDRNAVRLSLLVDYIGALATIFTGFYYLVSPTILTNGFQEALAAIAQMQSLQFESLIYSLAGILFLISSWVWEAGRPYMTLHGLWHLCSAYSGYLIGTYHHSVTTVMP
jgi:hypothetical protein